MNRVLLTPVGEIGERYLATEHLVPVHVLNSRLHLVWSEAHRVKAANQTPHAGAGNKVHRYMVLVKPLQHADVG